MIELKVVCGCGQKYKFDVEPVNGQMPFTVACPICRADGTAKANAMLQQMAVFKPIDPTPVTPPPPPPPAAPARLRINVTPAAESSAASASAPPPIAPATGVVLPPTSGRRPLAAAATAEASGKQPSFGMGILGGFLGALVGGIIYYLIYKFTGVRIGLAIGVGALAGWSADFLGKGEGSKELAGITIVFFIMAVIGAQYIVALEKWHKIVHAYEDAGYTDSVTEAKEVVKAVPTGTEGEIRLYLAKQSVDEGEAIKPASVSADEVKEFREKRLPEYQDLASGKVTKEQYLAKFGLDPDKMKKFQNEEEGTFKGVFMLLMLSRAGLISMIIGAGLAYKLSANA